MTERFQPTRPQDCRAADRCLGPTANRRRGKQAGRQRVRYVLDLATEECRELIRQYFLAGLSCSKITAAVELSMERVKPRVLPRMESAPRGLRGGSTKRMGRNPECPAPQGERDFGNHRPVLRNPIRRGSDRMNHEELQQSIPAYAASRLEGEVRHE